MAQECLITSFHHKHCLSSFHYTVLCLILQGIYTSNRQFSSLNSRISCMPWKAGLSGLGQCFLITSIAGGLAWVAVQNKTIWHKIEEAWRLLKYKRMEILGTTGLPSGWCEWTSTSGPSEPYGVSRPIPEQDCCLGLNCEMAFYRPARQRGFDKLAQLWLVAKALTTNYQRLYKELCCTRLPIWGHGRNAGLAMTWLFESIWTAEAAGPPYTAAGLTAKVMVQRVAIKCGERQSKTMWK